MKKATNFALCIVAVLAIALLISHARLASGTYAGQECAEAVRFIPVVGDITAMQDTGTSTLPEADEGSILAQLQAADSDPSVKDIVLLIDSNGGDGETAEEIAQVMSHVRKPKYALIRSEGTSAAYWIASSADKIFAFKASDIGSIGVTGSYVENASANQQDGQQFVSLASGQFKDTGNPDKPLTQADKDYLMKGVMDEYSLFVSAVAQNRNMPIEKVKAIADGSSVLGDEAVSDGLVDSVGGWDALWQQISKDIGTQCYSVQ